MVLMRASFDSIREGWDLRNLTPPLLFALQSHTASGLLLTNAGRGTIRSDLLRLISAAASDDFDFDCVKPLLQSALASEPDALVWDRVYDALTVSTPPPRPIASSLQQTPWLRNTSSIPNSSEHRKYVDGVLKEELGSMYVGVRHFHDAYFGGVAGLDVASQAFFKQCVEDSDPFFEVDWKGWPRDPNQDDVLSRFAEFNDKLAAFADGHRSISTHQNRRRPLAPRNKPIQGSTGERKLDVGFVTDTSAGKDLRYHWSQTLVPGELKSNPSADKASMAWLRLGLYHLRVPHEVCVHDPWLSLDERGAARVRPDNYDGKRGAILEVNRNGSTERIIIDQVMQRAPCIAGRATCWKAHHEGRSEMLLVSKDSWQYPERDEEGELLREATEKGVVNVARYYHHETVQIDGADDDIWNNVRRGLDITQAANYRPERAIRWNNVVSGTSREDRGRAGVGGKRSSSQTGAHLPLANDPVPCLQWRLSVHYRIEYIGGSSYETMGYPSTRRAPDRLYLLRSSAASKGMSLCIKLGFSTETFLSIIS
ncbi:hypothetical protein FBEOM_10965 [Fusarium beomiforme]|uniref:Fungal-type protein kinase domain-containing protein n=1 Tax=Fusarium beomiforme TaxID=44412 RepID=A0A9P5DRV8_9HYPO|nr:hypothetical protein FBEOM_10965 [Fusarium beomiforme]